jgi:hypothetical protein
MKAVAVTPETKVGELLEAYPEAEEALISIAPQFRALKNPVLRRTVAKVATLEQAARVAGVNTRDLVMSLREAIGIEGDAVNEIAEESSGDELPSWATPDTAAAIDAGALLDSGETPIAVVSKALLELETGEVLVIAAPFQPAPMIDALRSKGHDVVSRVGEGGAWTVWVRRN